MNTVRVEASRNYDIIIGRGVLSGAGAAVRSVSGAQTAAVISDSNVFPLYGERVCKALRDAGLRVVSYVFPAGEISKNLTVFGDVLNFLAENRLSRSDVAVALGGGTVGDLTGFAAASYRRGIEFVQIPTTLLSAVDSSVGGKTGVDLSAGKNLAGAFHQPSLVLCEEEIIAALPRNIFRDGCAEVIKYGLLGSEEFFRSLEEKPAAEQLEDVISVCVSMKRDIVKADEFDRGDRAKLNLGHTFGHAVEHCSRFAVSHGQAVAIGMAIITRAAAEKGLCGREVPERTVRLLKNYGLPTETEFSAEELFEAALSDKKVSGGSISLIVPDRVGHCEIRKIPSEEMMDWLKAGGVR